MPLLPLAAIIIGLIVLVWSADRFVAGAAAIARHAGMAPLLIGMLVVGFGTSTPEMLVSAIASWEGSSGIALGNAFGSNTVNIALIAGLTALITPIVVHSAVLRRELPILLGATVLTIGLVADRSLSRFDAFILLGVFAGVVVWSVRQTRRETSDSFAKEIKTKGPAGPVSLRAAMTWTAAGLVLLIASSRLLVWGAVEIALFLGVSDLILGLTVVAVGTSLPELASSLIAARRNQHDIALGNVIGSNLFNTLAVLGIAGAIGPMDVPASVLYRDLPVMSALTLVLVVACAGYGRPGRVNRFEGLALVAAFVAYTGYLALTA